MSMFCVGLYKAAEPGMILEPLRVFVYRIVINEHLRMPLFSCVYCMASVWGVVAYLLLYAMGYGFNTVELLFCCVCCVFVDGFLYSLLPE